MTKEILDMVEFRCRRKHAEIQDMLVPEVQDPLSAIELSAWVRERLATLPPERRYALQIKVALATVDLQEMVGELSRHLDAVRDKLASMNDCRRAAIAYSRKLLRTSRRH